MVLYIIYNLSSFINGVDFGQLYNEIVVKVLTNTLIDIISDSLTTIRIDFSNDLTAGEITILNNIVANFIIILPDGYNHWQYISTTNSNVSGDSLVANTWNVRQLNSKVCQNGYNIQLSANSILIYPGMYKISAHYITNGAGNHKMILYNETMAKTLLEGFSEYANGNNNLGMIEGHITIMQYSTLKFKQYSETTSTVGMGASNPFGTANIYMKVLICYM